jgi:hypothetical protein
VIRFNFVPVFDISSFTRSFHTILHDESSALHFQRRNKPSSSQNLSSEVNRGTQMERYINSNLPRASRKERDYNIQKHNSLCLLIKIHNSTWKAGQGHYKGTAQQLDIKIWIARDNTDRF